ncbi:hypothetical protein ACMGD3_24610 [Lysinibacillus sphaericus]|uniref:hypothetical protein n=1 Tax=Lysinibacillus sphaericus TaxID=1421 RepID=UPI001C5F3AB2
MKKIYIEAFKRILSERVIVEIFHDKGKTRYILGIKGAQNTFGANAEANACKTFDLIKKYATYCGYQFDFIINTFGTNRIPPRKAFIVCEIDKDFYNKIIIGKKINALNTETGMLQYQLVLSHKNEQGQNSFI